MNDELEGMWTEWTETVVASLEVSPGICSEGTEENHKVLSLDNQSLDCDLGIYPLEWGAGMLPLGCDVPWYNCLAYLDSTSDTVVFPLPCPFTDWIINGHFLDIISCADCCLQHWQVLELYSVYHRSSLVLCSVHIHHYVHTCWNGASCI